MILGKIKVVKTIYGNTLPHIQKKLAEDHILSWSNPGDIVLDPFMGSGTTAKMALKNERQFIGFEISQEYVDICNSRIKQWKEQDRLTECFLNAYLKTLPAGRN